MAGVRKVEVTQAGDGDKDGVSSELTWSEKEKEVKMSKAMGIERKLMRDEMTEMVREIDGEGRNINRGCTEMKRRGNTG